MGNTKRGGAKGWGMLAKIAGGVVEIAVALINIQ
jgi:hypothetical protein